ncbi:hypothetical protein [Pseudomonas sp. NPDC096950]|uniref:hypothetical protein n=1 Tax=Pseudomonas sp. NPDC096950 TaxID=3364485 RepID=UPI003839F9AD
MTPSQKTRFQKISQDMADLLDELHQGAHPDTVLFLEDGTPALYDWPADAPRRPDNPLVEGAYWHKSGGGGL